MGIFDIFKGKKENAEYKEMTTAQLIQAGSTEYSGFSGNLYQNDIVRACIHTNGLHTAKASAKVIRRKNNQIIIDPENERTQRLLNYNPNPYQTGFNFLYQVRTLYEIKGMAFIYIHKDYDGKILGYYPVQYNSIEAITDNEENILGYKFYSKTRSYTLPFNDVAVLIKYTTNKNYWGADNEPLYHTLDMLKIADEGIKNSIKLTSKLQGILKQTKGMLDPEDVKKETEQFVRDYVKAQNEGGIAGLDSSKEYIPLKQEPKTANALQMGLYEKRVMRFYGSNEAIIQNDFTEGQWTSYYEGSIEPFLIYLSLELTKKSFTDREKGYGNEIIYENNKLQYASTNTKLQLVSLVDRGLLTINEYREILNLAPVEGGDIRVIRREYMGTDEMDGENAEPETAETTE